MRPIRRPPSARWPWSASRHRQDQPRRGPALEGRRDRRPGQPRTRHAPSRLRPDGTPRAALAQFVADAPAHDGMRIHLIDTPGYPDFLGQSLTALEAVETAAIVVNAATGIEPMGVRMMEWARERELDRMIIVNKIDAQGVDLQALLGADPGRVRTRMPAAEPAGGGGAQVVDCFFNATQDGLEPTSRRVDAAHRALVEQVVEVDAGVRRALPERRRRRSARAARAARAGPARGPPDPGLLRHARATAPASPSCSTSSCACCRTRPRATRRPS